MEKVYSVSELNHQARQLIEQEFQQVQVEGEVSNFSRPASGHWYFTLIDQQAQISCIMFSFKNKQLKFLPKIGDLVRLHGNLTLYEARGSYQINVNYMETAGAGDLQREFLKLKERLTKEGLFDETHKQALPSHINTIGVITSERGAAISDVITTLKRRDPSITVNIIPTMVQGDQSIPQIVQALEIAENLKSPYKPDVILLTRGGGSIEDLWSFNDERVVRAVYKCTIPIISAVGHEIDFTLVDFVADQRAATPTAGAELLSHDKNEALQTIDLWQQRLINGMNRYLDALQASLDHCHDNVRHPLQRIQHQAQYSDELLNRITKAMAQQIEKRKDIPEQFIQRIYQAKIQTLQQRQSLLQQLQKQIKALSPVQILKRGYSVVHNQQGALIHSTKQVNSGESIKVRLASGALGCTIDSTHHEEPMR